MKQIWLLQDLKAVERLGRATLDKQAVVFDLPKGKESLLHDFRLLQESYRPGGGMFIVREGRLRFGKISPLGLPTIFAELGPGDGFGERPQPEGPNAFLEIEGKLAIYAMAPKKAQKLFADSRKSFEREIKFMSGLKRRRLVSNPADFLFQGPIEKIAAWLSRLDEEFANAPLPIGADEIAAMTGECLYRTYSALALMRKRGLLKIQKKRLQVVSAESLLQLSRRHAYFPAP